MLQKLISNLSAGVHALRDGISKFMQTKYLNFKINYSGKDEIGDTVDSFNEFLGVLEKIIKDAKASSNKRDRKSKTNYRRRGKGGQRV